MFKKVPRSIVKQVESGADLVPVPNILDHKHFRPLRLVMRPEEKWFCRSPPYKRTFYSLEDVLLPGGDDKSTEPLFLKGGSQGSAQFTVTKRVSDKVDGNVSASVERVGGEVNAGISLSKEWSIKLEKKEIPVEELEALPTKRKINMNHPLIQQLQKTKWRLYVIYETIEASEETTYKESAEAGGGAMARFYATLCVKGSKDNKESITIPKGCTLGFRVIPLRVENGSWDVEIFSMRAQEEFLFVSDGFSRGELRRLEAEVENNCQILPKLSLNVSIKLLEAIKAVMGDTNLFRELSQKMEAVLCGTDNCELKTESPKLKDLLDILRNSSRQLLLQMAEAIAYILEALDELTEDQLLLLLTSLEEKIVPQQLNLVKSILEHDIENEKSFSVDARLLSFSQEKEQELTLAMIEMSGATLRKDGSVVCKEDAFLAIAALCVSLYVLNLLSKQTGLRVASH
ncbi:PREDICTED: gasdermin-A [Calidris pugnax]|uniref:gasdermin-A n=1 Tax=Calidris pugnax TaxID=198806 RepID=UPI00071D1078|nr:PREDICTED: gasdermin-A [Calidris pugnax]